MATSSTARRIPALIVDPEQNPRSFDGGEPPDHPVRPNVQIGSNGWVAVIVFLGAEAMFFAGLIGAYIVFRVSAPLWPPVFQPRLPIGVTGINTLILLASAATMRLSLKAVQLNERKKMIRFIGYTAALGGIFLAIQGFEWVRLIHFGLTLSSSVYGGLFYTVIGFHGLHVLGGLIWVMSVFALAKAGRFSQERHVALQTCALYWNFVVGLWPLLYCVVYLL